MARIMSHFAAITAAVKLLGTATGFKVPKGFNQVGRVFYGGADGERLDFTFPGSEHKFAVEEVPAIVGVGEIVEQTRVQPAPGVWCGWKLPPGTLLDITPQGGESADNKWIGVEFCRGDEYPGKEPIHWVHAAATLGTIVDNGKLIDVPNKGKNKCIGIQEVAAHGAGTEYLGFKLTPKGDIYTIPGNHQAANAADIPILPTQVREPIDTDAIYWAEDANGYTGTAVAHLYFGLRYI